MKNILLPIYLVAAALCCGCNGKRENTAQEYVPNNPELIRRMECQMEASKASGNRLINNKTTIDKDSIRQKFNILANTYFPSLPNGILSATTHQLYRDAWAVPEDNIIDVGSQGLYLSYFILGYVADSVCIDSLSLFSRRDSTLAKVFTKTYYDGESVDDIIILNLIREHQDWVIDDLKMENGSTPPTSNIFLKQYLRNYIEEHRRYFRSEEWKSFVEKSRDHGCSAEADKRLQEIEDYFRKYPDMPSDSTIVQMFNAIEKRNLSKTPEGIFSSATMQLCRDAWAVPNDAFGDEGTNDEELNFILVGMEEDSLAAEKVEVYRYGDSTLAKVFITPFNRGHEYPQKRTRNFHLVEENGRWVIDDFDTWHGYLKQHLREYIDKQRKYFRSEDWKEYVERMKGDYDSIVVQNSLQEIEEYFRKYPD